MLNNVISKYIYLRNTIKVYKSEIYIKYINIYYDILFYLCQLKFI